MLVLTMATPMSKIQWHKKCVEITDSSTGNSE